MQRRQRMRPQLLPTHAERLAAEVVPLRCPEPGCQLSPPPWGGSHPGLHHTVEYEGRTPLYSWWGKLGTPFRCMDGGNMKRGIDRMFEPLTPKEPA